MANKILEDIAASAAMEITLNALASSVVGVGRQSTIIDNTTNRYRDILLYVKLTQGTSPTGGRGANVYFIRDDDDGHRGDGAGAGDAGITVLNLPLIGGVINKASPATDEIMYGEFLIHRPGPKWGIAIVHDTGVNLKNTDGDHWARYIGLNPEIQ